MPPSSDHQGGMSMGQNAYLEGLNPPQREAVLTTDVPLLVLSGAGTGKTRVLTSRIAHILTTRQAFPSQILAVTFTNRAAGEMRERLRSMMGPSADGLMLGTFHSLAAKMLRIHGSLLGFSDRFTILDADDQLRLIKQILKQNNYDEKAVPPKAVLAAIQRWKDRALTCDQLQGQHGDHHDVAQKIYVLYQEELARLDAMDFGDLTLHCLSLFKRHPDVLTNYQRQFRFILVDEYQDTNVAQYLWLRLLVQGGANLCCVGDDDQSIYGWRGAEVGNILKFSSDFPDAHTIRLEQNYRSTTHILGAASHLISQNQGRLGKTLWTEQSGGERVTVCGLWDEVAEALYIADEVESFQRKGTRLEHMAVLVRAGFQTRAFEERFLQLGIPYRVVGGLRFYERQEIRDALAYLRLIAQPNDNLAFERIVNLPKRGVGEASLKQLQVTGRAHQVSLMEATRRMVETEELKPAIRRALGHFIQQIDHWRDFAQTTNPADLTKKVLEESGYIQMWQNDPAPDAPGRVENLREFVVALESFDTLPGFLEHVSLVMEHTTTQGEDMVTLMTLHSAKGLEFNVVFLPGWEEGLFPHARSLAEKEGRGLEEERRLAYVGITRAKIKAFITYTANRRVHNLRQSNAPSRFINDLPDQHIEMLQNSNSWSRPVYKTPAYRTNPSSVSVSYVEEHMDEPAFLSGQRVFHMKFGYGRVTYVQGVHVTVNFEHSGEKKVMVNYLEKA